MHWPYRPPLHFPKTPISFTSLAAIIFLMVWGDFFSEDDLGFWDGKLRENQALKKENGGSYMERGLAMVSEEKEDKFFIC